MYARPASSSQPATHTNSSPTPMMVLYSPPTNCTMVTRWDGMVAGVGHLEHVGEVCRLDDEGVEGPGHHEGGVAGGEGGEDSGEGEQQQHRHQHPLAAVQVRHHAPRQHARHHAREVEGLEVALWQKKCI